MRISFMRWRPGSDGREPRERRKWLEINGVPSRARFRMFIRNRLWIGLPPAFVAGFGVVLLLLVSGGESTPERSLVRASIAGSLCVFGWILGVWAATGPDSEPVAENSEQASGDRFAPRKLRWWLWILCGGAAICYAVFSPSIGRIVEGERTVLEGAAEIVSKVLTVVCVMLSRFSMSKTLSSAVTSSGRIRSAGTVFPCRSLLAVFDTRLLGARSGGFSWCHSGGTDF